MKYIAMPYDVGCARLVAWQGRPWRDDVLCCDVLGRGCAGERVRDVARNYGRGGRLLPISQIVTSDGWNTGDFTVTCIESGSFVRYIADVHGIESSRLISRVSR